MKKYIAFVTVLLVVFCVDAGAQRTRKRKAKQAKAVAEAPAGITYLRAIPGGNSPDISWIYLGRDGTIIKDPKYGVDPVDLVSEKKRNAAKTGRYRFEGDKMVINWENGKTAEWKTERQGTRITSIDGVPVGQQSPMPDNYRLSGQYSAESFMPNLPSSTTIVFDKDGSFTQTTFGGVNTASGSAVSQDITEGKYDISGNTLRMNYSNGEKAISMITVWPLKDGKKYLVINGSAFPQK